MDTTGTVAVDGATIFYKAVGQGPVLLVLQGGATDSGGSDALAAHLRDHFTVVSLDRRGLSRSAVTSLAAEVSIATHADDAWRVLQAVTAAPAFLLGISIGGVIGVELVIRHPEMVRTLVTFEPPLGALLSEAERAPLVEAQLELERVHAQSGAQAAMGRFIAMLGIRFEDREPDAPMPSRGASLLPNLEFFIRHDAPAVRRYVPDVAALQAASGRIVPAIGRTSPAARPGQLASPAPALALAALLGQEAVDFPGGHNAYASHPRGFAARILEVLARSA